MTARDLAVRDDSFPAITGDIEQDTETLVSELAVGTIVVERGMARLYMVWKSRGFLNLLKPELVCKECNLEFATEPDGMICPRCQRKVASSNVPVFPTLEAYLSYIADETGKSRQTLFSRLKVYRVLADERGVNPARVFELNLLSSGAATQLARALEDDPHLNLENDSWADTVDVALSQSTKGAALEYVKYDVLKQPKIMVDQNDDETYTVYREYLSEDDLADEYVVEQYEIKASGKWPSEMKEWLTRKLGAKAAT